MSGESSERCFVEEIMLRHELSWVEMHRGVKGTEEGGVGGRTKATRGCPTSDKISDGLTLLV